MGEGLYRSRDGHTAYAEPFDHLAPEDGSLWRDAYDDLIDAIRACLGSNWEPMGRTWRGRGEHVVARNGLHEVWLVEDSYARVHVTFGVREELDAAAPSAALLPVVFSRVLDQSWSKVPLDSDQVCTSGLNTIRNREAPFFQVCTSGFTEERVCGYFVY